MKDFLLLIPILSGLIKKLKKENKSENKKSSSPKTEISIFYFLVPIKLCLILTLLLLVEGNINSQISKYNLFQIPFQLQDNALYPKIKTVLGAETQAGFVPDSIADISAKAAVVVDNDSKVVLFSKNPNLRFSMASTTKIMTALTALEYYKLDDVLTIKSDNVEGAVVGFKKGEQWTFESLLYAMLLPSGNDAALAIAQNYPEGEEIFIEKMNSNAQRFNLFNTHFSDPTGLNDDGDYTTVVDLARLASIALRNEVFSNVVSSKSRLISNIDGTSKHALYSLNKLLGIDGVNGIKTGFTEEAEGVLVTSKVEQGHTLILVVMKSKDRFFDTQRLLFLVSGNLAYSKLDPNL